MFNDSILNKKVCLDLGCGMRKPLDNEDEVWHGVDVRKFKDVDFVLNVGKEILPLADESVDFIQAIHLFEHFYPEELFFCVNECWRVLKPLGKLHIEVPKAGTPAYYVHPDHKIQFVEDTFGFWQVPGNKDHRDPHGYLKRFWHVNVVKPYCEQLVVVNMYPNKPNGEYPYVKVLVD